MTWCWAVITSRVTHAAVHSSPLQPLFTWIMWAQRQKLCRRKFRQHSPEWAKVHRAHTHLCFFFPLHYLTLWLCFVSVLSQRGEVKERRHVTVSKKTVNLSLAGPVKVQFDLNNRHPCGQWWTDVKQPSQTCAKLYKFRVLGSGKCQKNETQPSLQK